MKAQMYTMHSQSEETRASKIRRTYGQNTIVWFLRGHNRAVYGLDAEVMENVFGMHPEYDPSTEKMVTYWNRTQDDILYPRLVKLGYKICCLIN